MTRAGFKLANLPPIQAPASFPAQGRWAPLLTRALQ